jgi:hypothetical protein
LYKLLNGRSENSQSGVSVLCQHLERIVEQTGATVVSAHHFPKGNAAAKKALDRMSGSGVFARDADTIMTLTEHEQEGCYAVELTLRNLPTQPAFVVEFDYPLMVERPDLDPADLNREVEQPDPDLESLLALLDDTPLTTGKWQAAAKEAGFSRATFFRWKSKLEATHRVQFDQRTKAWSRSEPEVVVEPYVAPETNETCETDETSKTHETSKPTLLLEYPGMNRKSCQSQ